MILVPGATGMVGRQVCRLLMADGKGVRAMVKATSDQAKVDELKRLGASVVQADLCDPDSIRAAADFMQRSFAGLMIGLDTVRATEMESAVKSFPLELKTVREHAGEVLMA